MNHEGAVSGKLLIYWLVTIILPCLVLLLPVNEIMTADLKVFLSITLVAILFIIFEQVNGTVVTIITADSICADPRSAGGGGL